MIIIIIFWKYKLFIIVTYFNNLLLSLEFEIGVVANNATGEVSVDQYHHYKVSDFFSNQKRRVPCAAYEKT